MTYLDISCSMRRVHVIILRLFSTVILGVADVEVCPCPYQSPQNETHPEAHLKRSALSNSLLDMHEQCKL